MTDGATSGGARPPMRILEIETFGRGGLAHYVHNLSVALAERGHEVTLLTAAGYELAGLAEAPDGRQIVETTGRASRRLGRLPAFARGAVRKAETVFDALAVAAEARRRRPDVIHLHCTNPSALLYASALARLDPPLVATAHVVTPHEPIPFQQAVYRSIHRRCDLIVAHSEHDRRRLVEEFAVDAGRVAVIPHGEYGFFERLGRGREAPVDRTAARRSLGLGPGDRVALFFGYIREYKGLDVLLEAWPRVAEAVPAARLVVAGDPVRLGPGRRAELERRAEHLGALTRFGYVPFSDVGGTFAAADTLVLPYRHVSQSGVLYLALALGLPVVATRVGAFREMLRDGESALLVPPESPGDLARALIRLFDDDALRGRLVRGGRKIARAHSWPSIAGETEGAFRRAVEAAGTPAPQRDST